MMWKDVVYLGNETETIDHGETIKGWAYRKVFANKKSVRASEFYQAATIGLKPELIFEVRSCDFCNDERLKFDDIEYFILRTYDRGEVTELTVSTHTGGVS